MRESPKHDNLKSKLADLLSDGQWHSSMDVVQVAGIRGTARLYELRHEDGWEVEKRKIPGSTQYEFRLVQRSLSLV